MGREGGGLTLHSLGLPGALVSGALELTTCSVCGVVVAERVALERRPLTGDNRRSPSPRGLPSLSYERTLQTRPVAVETNNLYKIRSK
jgi:hypothetical protein